MVDSYVITVDGTPMLLATAPLGAGERKIKIYVANLSGTTDIFIGDANVTASTGYQIVKQAGQTIGYRQEFELFGGESLYAVCSPATSATISVLVTGL